MERRTIDIIWSVCVLFFAAAYAFLSGSYISLGKTIYGILYAVISLGWGVLAYFKINPNEQAD
jgi:hypothetical protein